MVSGSPFVVSGHSLLSLLLLTPFPVAGLVHSSSVVGYVCASAESGLGRHDDFGHSHSKLLELVKTNTYARQV